MASLPTTPHFWLYIPTDHVHTLRPQGSALRGKYCHILYLMSNLSSPTPTFWTYLRPLLQHYFNSSSPDPFCCYATTIIVSLHFYFLLLSPIVPCPLLSPIVSIPCYFRLAFWLATSAHYYHYYLSLSYMLWPSPYYSVLSAYINRSATSVVSPVCIL